RLGAVERRHGDLAAERQRRIGHRHFAKEVVAFALEERMLLHVHDDVEIAGRTARRSGFALTGEPQPLARRDARWHADGELPLLLHAARALARQTRLGDDGTRAAALRAR